MVNFLFISNHSKIQTVQRSLQHLLKVRIDIVGDFDCGLKEVFEKRPALVFVQDQISGVTGESVARHIQMLLGAGGPSFVYLHDGNQKAKPVRGLYEHLIDLSQPHKKVMSDIQDSLKLLLGEQWQNIYMPPRTDVSAVKAALAVPEEQRKDAEKLVDDFISDLGNAVSEVDTVIFPLKDFSLPQSPQEEPFEFVSSPQDQLAELLVEASATAGHGIVTPADAFTQEPPATPAQTETVATDRPDGAPDGGAAPSSVQDGQSRSPLLLADEPPQSRTLSGEAATPPLVAPDAGTAKSNSTPSASPADFVIKRDTTSTPVANGVFLRSTSGGAPGRKRSIAIALVLLLSMAAVAWYLYLHKPNLRPSGPNAPTTAVAPAAVPEPPPVAPKPVAVCPLPSFVPVGGHDRAFASQKPGWERYVGPELEFRVYCEAGRLKAMQVLSVQGKGIDERTLKSLVAELTGSADYRVTSREDKHGFLVSRATVNRKADLLIYRKGALVKAVVVSLSESR